MINYDYDAVRYKDAAKKQRILQFLKILLYYLVCFFMSVTVVNLYSFLGRKVIIFALIAGLLASIVSHFLVPTDRPNQMKMAKQNLLIYNLVLLGAYFIISVINRIDPNMMGVSLGLSTGQVINNAYSGWLTMAIQIIAIGAPVSHVLMEVKRIFTYASFGIRGGKVTKRKRAEQLQKTIVR